LEGFRLPRTVRVETGFEEGDPVSPFYDPMIAKIIATSTDREGARTDLANALEVIGLWPIQSYAPFLVRGLWHPEFQAGSVTTGFLEMHGDELTSPVVPNAETVELAAKNLMAANLPDDAETPWNAAIGFRLNRTAQNSIRVSLNGDLFAAAVTSLPNKLDDPGAISLNGQTFRVGLPMLRGSGAAAAGDGAILAPMPGKVTSVEVAAGDAVTKGQRLLTLEAMKMEHGLVAPFDGVVAELNAAAGAQVQVDAVLARIEKSSSPA
jgi:3-methylcrotonyl-CoA carboxylase alpha subunit